MNKSLPQPLIDPKQISRVAHLARLNPDEAERVLLRQELERILRSFDRLEWPDTRNTEPIYHPHPDTNRLRPDEVQSPFDPADLIHESIGQDGFLMAPKTME